MRRAAFALAAILACLGIALIHAEHENRACQVYEANRLLAVWEASPDTVDGDAAYDQAVSCLHLDSERAETCPNR